MTPTSATGRSSNQGFSLLEVLVVVFIVGVLATMFTLSIGVTGGDRQLDTEVDRLIAVVDLAREEAVVQGRELGLHFYTNSYEFAAYFEDFIDYHDEENPDLSEWALLDKATLLGPRELPEGLLFELRIDGREVVLKNAGEDDTALSVQSEESEESEESAPVKRYEPQVMIYSSGDMNPFTIELRRAFANTGTIIEFDIDGSVEIEAEDR